MPVAYSYLYIPYSHLLTVSLGQFLLLSFFGLSLLTGLLLSIVPADQTDRGFFVPLAVILPLIGVVVVSIAHGLRGIATIVIVPLVLLYSLSFLAGLGLWNVLARHGVGSTTAT